MNGGTKRYELWIEFVFYTQFNCHGRGILGDGKLQYGGAELTATLERLNGRIPCVHLKDYKLELDEKNNFVPTMAPVGDGVIDFVSLIEKMKTLGVECYIVEQDNAADMPDSLSQVERSIRYLKKI